ncbi:BTB POZ fold protein [Rutstroemia sp. NJR-2017a BVV2]|nr:BTB POZ fold protein [Rutstroemia sp. NJR-2017a BVV2]
MAKEYTVKQIVEVPYQNFITSYVVPSLVISPSNHISFLPLYSGPCVKVRIGSGSAGHEYELSRAILCKQSPYFAATFEGAFREGQDQSTTLVEEEGVVSQRSFEMLVQWLYIGRIRFGEPTPTECITAIMEFVRLADMCEVTGMETQMAEHIKNIILANPPPEDKSISKGRHPDTNTFCIVGQHITSANLLPRGHPVRKILVIAAVEGYIRRNKHKFLKEICVSPDFAVDLLLEVKETLKTVASENTKISFEDPFSGETVAFVTQDI